MSEHTAGRLVFERDEAYTESARLLKKELGEHEGYPRENSGDWIVLIEAPEGCNRFGTVSFRGAAKRGKTWNAPDSEGQANARRIVAAWNACEGIETHTLETASQQGGFGAGAGRAMIERDELVDFLRDIVRVEYSRLLPYALVEHARALIAKHPKAPS